MTKWHQSEEKYKSNFTKIVEQTGHFSLLSTIYQLLITAPWKFYRFDNLESDDIYNVNNAVCFPDPVIIQIYSEAALDHDLCLVGP